MKRSVRCRLVVAEIAPGGDGVAHVEHDGERRAVFVPAAAPGDELVASVDFSSRPARASDVRVERAGPGRRAPSCPHADACGGCSLIQLTPEARRDALGAIVGGTVLRALGDAAPAHVHHEAPREEGFRTRARLGVVGAKNAAIVGFRARGGGRLVEIPTCLVLDARLAPVLAILRSALAGATGKGEASIALGRGARPVVELAWEGELPASAFGAFDSEVARGALAGAAIRLAGTSAPAVIGDATVLTLAADGAPLEVPAGGFAQASPEVSVALARHVGAVAATAGRDVVELYAGAGNLTTLLARGAKSYLAVESDLAAVTFARKSLAARGLAVRIAHAEAAKAPWPRRCDVVVLDPPRAGAKEVLAAIDRAKPRDVVYVSCDPATLARDAATLVKLGFAPRSLHTFDMFPHTHHVESVLHLGR